MEDLDKKIIAVQKSTRTLFRFRYFLQMHNFFRLRFPWYYRWHTQPISSVVHYIALALFLAGGTFIIMGHTDITEAAISFFGVGNPVPTESPVAATPAQTTTPAPDNSDQKIQDLIDQVSRLATNETLKTVASEISGLETLSSEETQNEIKNKIETNLAKDDSVKALLNSINSGNGVSKTALADLASLLAKVASDSTLVTLTDKLETGLAKEETLSKIYDKLVSDPSREATLQEISTKLEALATDSTLSEVKSKMESGLAKDATLTDGITDLLSRLTAIETALSDTLSVSVSNWITAITISNFPTDYPSTSSTRAQEQVGNDYFNRSENLDIWALRKGYSKIYLSGEVTNPTPAIGTIEVGRLAVPAGHTYYLDQISFSSTGTKNNLFKILLTAAGAPEELSDKFGFSAIDTRSLSYSKKLAAGEQIRVTIDGVSNPNGTSTISIYYLDLPWVE